MKTETFERDPTEEARLNERRQRKRLYATVRYVDEVWWQAGERGRARFTLAFANGNLSRKESDKQREREKV